MPAESEWPIASKLLLETLKLDPVNEKVRTVE